MDRRQLLIATRNKGKIDEIRLELRDLTFEIIGLDEAGVPKEFEVEETAMTMEGNAIIKAMIYGRKTGLLTLSEDAGLEVDALDGRPGVVSARYAPGTDEDRYRKLLEEMKDVPDDKRGAKFRAVVAMYDPKSEKIRTCEGVYRGVIAREPRGTNGFGYDPIFYNTELKKTNAEMTKEEKNSVSHRGMSLRKAKVILAQEFGEQRVIMQTIKVMYIEVESPAQSKQAFDELESRFESLRGRKFYGVAFDGKYWAAVKIEEGDEPKKLGLQVGEIPGGEYVKERIVDWTEHVHEIGPKFDDLATKHERDPDRPSVEFYRSQKELQLWVPIRKK